jgi:hypothetical protein
MLAMLWSTAHSRATHDPPAEQGVASKSVASLASLEILHGALVLLSGLARIECAKVPPPIRSRVDPARIKPILARFELAYHVNKPLN